MNDITIRVIVSRSKARKIDIDIKRLGESTDDVVEFTADFFEKAARKELDALIKHAGGEILTEIKRGEQTY